MFFRKQMMALVAVAIVAVAVTGCTTVGTKSDAEVASYTQGALSETVLNEKLIMTNGMQSLLDLVDKGILDAVQPVTDIMTTSVTQRLESIKTQYKDNFEVTLRMNGFDSEEGLKNALLLDAQRAEYVTQYIASTLIKDEEIKAYYDSFEPEIQASHILIQPKDETEAALTEAKNLTIDLIKRINAGEDFAVLAKEFSKDPGSGAIGGDLGSFGKGKMAAEFEAAAFALKVGEVTPEPVQTQFGYHIIKKTGESTKKILEEMKAEIVKTLADQKVQADQSLSSKALAKLRADNKLVIKNPVLAKQYELFTNQLTAQ